MPIFCPDTQSGPVRIPNEPGLTCCYVSGAKGNRTPDLLDANDIRRFTRSCDDTPNSPLTCTFSICSISRRSHRHDFNHVDIAQTMPRRCPGDAHALVEERRDRVRRNRVRIVGVLAPPRPQQRSRERDDPFAKITLVTNLSFERGHSAAKLCDLVAKRRQHRLEVLALLIDKVVPIIISRRAPQHQRPNHRRADQRRDCTIFVDPCTQPFHGSPALPGRSIRYANVHVYAAITKNPPAVNQPREKSPVVVATM